MTTPTCPTCAQARGVILRLRRDKARLMKYIRREHDANMIHNKWCAIWIHEPCDCTSRLVIKEAMK